MKILEIKLLKHSQIEEIVALDRICLGGLWTAEGYAREINSPNSNLLILRLSNSSTSKANSKIIGIASLWSILEEAHITLLAIHPKYRRQGLGTLLLLALLKNAIARQLEWATLEVNVNNQSAIKLYQKFGFEVVGTRKKYYQSTGDDASILWLKNIQDSSFQRSLDGWQQKIEGSLRHNHYHLYVE